mgnify:CR=1 FL=1
MADILAVDINGRFYNTQEERFRREYLGEIELTNVKIAVQQNLFEL